MARSRSPLRVLATLAVLLAPPARLAAETSGIVVLQNDSVVDFGTANIQVGFVAGERAAAWLTSSCTGDLIALRVLWLSSPPTGGTTLGEYLRLSEAGVFPVPGPVLRELPGPLLTEGAFNEFALTPPVSVLAGETVVVDFQFLTSPPLSGPSVVTDVDGCQAGKNGIYATPPNAWFSACVLGVSGDFAIRAVVDCGASQVFSDGFESGDTSAWTLTVP
jgi:hypothetical protein